MRIAQEVKLKIEQGKSSSIRSTRSWQHRGRHTSHRMRWCNKSFSRHQRVPLKRDKTGSSVKWRRAHHLSHPRTMATESNRKRIASSKPLQRSYKALEVSMRITKSVIQPSLMQILVWKNDQVHYRKRIRSPTSKTLAPYSLKTWIQTRIDFSFLTRARKGAKTSTTPAEASRLNDLPTCKSSRVAKVSQKPRSRPIPLQKTSD